MPDKKICPLTHYVLTLVSGSYDTDFDCCVEGKCAWWDKDLKKCAIPAIASYLYKIFHFK